MFFDRGHLRFRNFYSPIPVNVVRVKSSVNCLFDLARVVIRVTIKQSAVCQEMPMSFKLLLLQLGFTCSTAADKLRFILLDSQCLRAFNQGFPLFFFLVVLTSESGNLTYMKNIYFLSSLERPMETSWRNTASRHRDNVHVYDK